MGRNRGTRLSILWIHLHPVQPRSPAVRKAALASSAIGPRCRSGPATLRDLLAGILAGRPARSAEAIPLAGDREGVVVPAPVTALTQAMGHPAVLGLLRILGPAARYRLAELPQQIRPGTPALGGAAPHRHR